MANLCSNWISLAFLRDKITMSKIGYLQNCLEDIFDEYTPKFVNKMHWIQLQYRVEKNRRILVFVQIFWQNGDRAVMKCAMYASSQEDLDFLRAYLAGLVLTLGIEYVMVELIFTIPTFCVTSKMY